jgi:Cu-processing system ATP-binding protein
VIRVCELSKAFGGVGVLSDVSFAMRRGVVTALVGPNGSGKTTLIKTILGLVRADAGAIEVDGVVLNGGDRGLSRIGYMPQTPHFPQHLTGRDLLAMVADLRGVASPPDLRLVEALRLSDALDKPFGALSGGTRQKLNAAMAFAFAPDLLILDEPTAGLDPVSSGVVKDRIASERAAGRTVLVTSHVMTELEELAQDVICLVEGRVAFAGGLATLIRSTRQSNMERAVAHVMLHGAAA